MAMTWATDVTMLEVSALSAGSAPFGPVVKQWTVEEYHKMIDLGLLAEGAPIELIEGMLVYKNRGDSGGRAMTQGPRHSLAVAQLVALNSLLVQLGFHIRIQSPITISPLHEPEPDGVVLPGRPVAYRDRLPRGEEASLVIEVADSSLDFDRSVKLPIYAKAAIPLYWIVNLRENIVEAYQRPEVSTARYGERRDYRLGDVVELPLPGANPVSIPVDQIIADAA